MLMSKELVLFVPLHIVIYPFIKLFELNYLHFVRQELSEDKAERLKASKRLH